MNRPVNTYKLPIFFKSILWSYDIYKIKPQKAKKEIIVNAFNYGDWRHIKWVVNYYGKREVRESIQEIPASEFRPPALELAKTLLGIQNVKYVSRSDKVRSRTRV